MDSEWPKDYWTGASQAPPTTDESVDSYEATTSCYSRRLALVMFIAVGIALYVYWISYLRSRWFPHHGRHSSARGSHCMANLGHQHRRASGEHVCPSRDSDSDDERDRAYMANLRFALLQWPETNQTTVEPVAPPPYSENAGDASSCDPTDAPPAYNMAPMCGSTDEYDGTLRSALCGSTDVLEYDGTVQAAARAQYFLRHSSAEAPSSRTGASEMPHKHIVDLSTNANTPANKEVTASVSSTTPALLQRSTARPAHDRDASGEAPPSYNVATE